MKKILFFLIPKQKVVFVYDDFTLQEALDTMKKDRFSAIPVLNRNGEYIGTLSEGDLLWYVHDLEDFDFSKANDIHIKDIPRIRNNQPVNINANMDTLISIASNINFVPIIDDSNQFMGIITRKEIIDYFFEHKFIVL